VAAIAAVWTLATADSSNPNISIRADSDDTTDAYMQALNLVRAMHEKAAAQGEQGLEDIEDLDEVESPPASSDDPSVDSDSSHFMSCLERSCSPSMYDVAAAYVLSFLLCGCFVFLFCGRFTELWFFRNPSGSQLLQCLSSAPDGVTATACWAPESDDAQGTPTHLTFETEEDLDAEQTVRICAVCNGCIPGSVGPNE